MTWGEGAQLLTALAVAATFVRGWMADRRADRKLDALHVTTNSLAERNEAIAKKLGIEEGRAAEKANPSS